MYVSLWWYNKNPIAAMIGLFVLRTKFRAKVEKSARLAYFSLKLTFIQHFVTPFNSSHNYSLTASPSFQINKCVFQILCNKNLARGRGKPHSALLWRSSNVHYFLAGSEQMPSSVCVWSLLSCFPFFFPLLPECFNCSSKGVLQPSRGASHTPWKD